MSSARHLNGLSNWGKTVFHTHTGPNGYDNRASDLHQLSGVARLGVLYGLMNRPNITTTMIYWILEYRQDHTKWLTEYGDFVPSDGEDER